MLREAEEERSRPGAAIINPYSTGITYQLIPKASVDKVPVHSMGYGRTAAGDGRVFKWAFTAPTSYWSQATAFIKYVGEQEGGLDKLKGKKITLIYHNSGYGKEPIPTLKVLSEKHGYNLNLLAVDHPGQEQKSTWLQVRRQKPDYIFMWGWGVMNQVAIKEAAAIKYPDGQVHRGLVVGLRERRPPGRRGRQGLQGRRPSTASAPATTSTSRSSRRSITAMWRRRRRTTGARCSTIAAW